MKAILKRPSPEEQEVAGASLHYFASLTESKHGRRSPLVEIRLQENGEAITIPRKALELLRFVLARMAEGKAVSLVPAESELSTQQAADLLNVSRPHLVKLLEQGALPFRKVGSHRRVQLEDLLRYERQQAERRNQQLQFLAQQAQELSMGYE